MARNLYDVLGVSKTDSHDTIKKAYRKLARDTHPDRNKDDPKAAERFKEIGSAWDVIGDPEKRSLYDEFGDVVTKPGFDADQARAYKAASGARGRRVDFGGGQAVDLGDLLGGMFGMGGGGRAGFGGGFNPGAQGFGGSGFGGGFGASPGADQEANLTLDFRTAVLGSEQTLRMGDGRSLTVRIPEGIRDGETLKLRGKGGRGQNGGRNGDLHIHVKVQADPDFRREGLDLYRAVDITAVQAVRGGKVTVPTLDGELRVTVPAGAQSGQKLRLSGKGVKRRDKRGDLFVELRIVLPAHLPDDLLDALEAAYASEGEAV